MSVMRDTEDSVDTTIDFDDGDETELSLAPELDLEQASELESEQTPLGTRAATAARRQSAWQRLDERKDDAWLKDQLADWDDWDEDAGAH